MSRFKAYDYNQLIMVPVSLEDQLVLGTLEYAIHHLLENPPPPNKTRKSVRP